MHSWQAEWANLVVIFLYVTGAAFYVPVPAYELLYFIWTPGDTHMLCENLKQALHAVMSFNFTYVHVCASWLSLFLQLDGLPELAKYALHSPT